MDPSVDAVGALRYAAGERRRLISLVVAAEALRREAARRMLGSGVIPRPWTRGQLETWARAPGEITCAKGHSRAEHGLFTGQRWTCRRCIADSRMAAKPKRRVPTDATRRATRIRDRWEAHERRVAQAPLDDPRLRPELPPPWERPGRA